MKPYYEDGAVTIYHGDSFDLLPDLRFQADAVVTDPPFVYSVANSSNNYLTDRPSGNSWSESDVMGRWFATALDFITPRMIPEWSLLSFCSPVSYPVFFPHAFRRFDKVTGVVWDKGRFGTGARWRRQFEMVLYAYNDGAYWAEGLHDRSDVVAIKPSASAGRAHPVDKPVELLAYLMEPITHSASLVLDPFMGGGSTLLAAKGLGRRAIGIEMEERYCEIAARRCSQEVLGLSA